MNMTITEAHEYSDELKRIIAEKQPNHPMLKKYFGSVWDEIDALEIIANECPHKTTVALNEEGNAGIYCSDCGEKISGEC